MIPTHLLENLELVIEGDSTQEQELLNPDNITVD
jgi:hypothetical protein